MTAAETAVVRGNIEAKIVGFVADSEASELEFSADLSRDETLRAARTNCTDALYDEARWAALLAAGCTNADVVNFCVPEEEAAGS